jgi:hypothetical protein
VIVVDAQSIGPRQPSVAWTLLAILAVVALCGSLLFWLLRWAAIGSPGSRESPVTRAKNAGYLDKKLPDTGS